jgi:hypothetical protein
MTMKVAMMLHRSTQDAEMASVWPSFVRVLPLSGEGFALDFSYWAPERTGVSDRDYQLGVRYFAEAIAFSHRHNCRMLLAHAVMGMFGHIGHVEAGFIDGMLKSALHGAVPPPVAGDEIAPMSPGYEDNGKFRESENAMITSIKLTRTWGGPELVYLHLISCLTGKEGPFIGGAVSVVARTALNGSRH